MITSDYPNEAQRIIDDSRRVADTKFAGITEEEWKLLRRKCKTDLFFLCRFALGYRKLSPELHGHLCAWLKQTQEYQYREILLPRGHYKSTVITIAESIQIVLPDDVGDQPWPRNLGPNCRMLIAHEVDKMAGRFLISITQHFTQNPILMGLFPECVPNPRQHRINARELELPRSEIWSEPTIDTMGVGGRSQGRHYNYLKLDDLFGDKARDSEAERISTYNWFDNIQSFFSTFSKDRLDLIGTRWAVDDIYSHAHKFYGEELVRYIRSCEEKDQEGKLTPIFPEEFPQPKLKILKKKPLVWNAQYVNNPRDGGTAFQPEWKRYFEWSGPNAVQYTEKRGHLTSTNLVSLRDCGIYILVDPAPKNLAGYLITAVSKNWRIFILKADKQAFKPHQLIERIFSDVVRYNAKKVIIEAVNFSEIYEDWLRVEMPKRGIRFKVEPGKTRNAAKEERVLALDNWFSNGQIYFGPNQEDLEEEYDNFGSISDYHLLDALAYGPEFWRPGSVFTQTPQAPPNRDPVTGYSIESGVPRNTNVLPHWSYRG